MFFFVFSRCKYQIKSKGQRFKVFKNLERVDRRRSGAYKRVLPMPRRYKLSIYIIIDRRVPINENNWIFFPSLEPNT